MVMRRYAKVEMVVSEMWKVKKRKWNWNWNRRWKMKWKMEMKNKERDVQTKMEK